MGKLKSRTVKPLGDVFCKKFGYSRAMSMRPEICQFMDIQSQYLTMIWNGGKNRMAEKHIAPLALKYEIPILDFYE